MKRLILVRHGESEWNSARRLQGQADISLSPRGAGQVRRLAPVVAALAPDRVITSDLARARETARLLGFPTAEPLAALREIDVGDWTGREIGALEAAGPGEYGGWRAGTFTPPGGESWADFRARTLAGAETALAGAAARLLLVSHGGVIRALLEALVGLPPSRIVPVGPASLTVLALGAQGEARLESFNFSPDGPMLDAPD